MAGNKLRIVHYINQFYGQIGGEDKADVDFSVKEGPFGPGILLQALFGDDAEVVGTIICGDNYFASRTQEASEKLIKLVEPFKADLFFAGPAFNAGRYGIACGQACKAIAEKFNIPVFSGMYQENPGVDLYRNSVMITKTHNSAAQMKEDLGNMVRTAKNVLRNSQGHKFLTGVGIGTPEEEGYFPQMMIKNVFTEKTGAARAVDMLLDKIHGRPFKTELEYPTYDEFIPPEPVKDMKKCRIAVVSDGGLVDKDNKGRLRGRSCGVWTSYNLDDFMSPDKTEDDYVIAHEGYFHSHVMQDRNRIVPYDVLTELEKEKLIGVLHREYYVTGGNSTVIKWCGNMGQEIAQKLLDQKVGAVILTST